MIFCYIEGLLRFPHRLWVTLRKYVFIFGILCIIPILSRLYFGSSLQMDWIMGSYEKHHGFLFYCSILCLIFLLIASPSTHLKLYLNWSMASATFVACIAIGEYMGGIFDIYGRSEMLSMYPGRSSSTLGNPNYVAGYLLPFIPILLMNIRKIKIKRISDINIHVLVMIHIIII